MTECLVVGFRQEPVYFTPPPEAKFLVPDRGHRVCRTGLPACVPEPGGPDDNPLL